MRPFGRPVSVGFFVPLTGTLCNVNSGRLEPGAAFFHTSPPSDESHPRWFQPTIIVPQGLFLQPGIKATVENGVPIYVPYVICLANGCVAGTVADPSFVRELEAGRVVALAAVNSNELTGMASFPLGNVAKVLQ